MEILRDILSEDVVRAVARECEFKDAITRVSFFDAIASTNEQLLNEAPPRAGFALSVARRQSQGRGRYRRVWVSPPGGVYFSLARAAPTSRARCGMLGMNMVSKLASALRGMGADVMVKPPNDIVCAAGKLAGVLVETSDAVCVLGVGINVYRPRRAADGFAKAAYLSELLSDELLSARAAPPSSMPSLMGEVLKRAAQCGILSFQETFEEERENTI